MTSVTKTFPVYSSREIRIAIGGITLEGHFSIPENANSIVIFSHGSGSGRFSPRNNYVAEILNEKNIATLLTDLLTKQEDLHFENRFDIELLSERLVTVTRWVQSLPGFENIPIGYFGASTGAASALVASVSLKNQIKAIVCRGGRPDLAESILEKVYSPTLLLVGSLDKTVIEFNSMAYQKLACEKELQIIQGATHLFEEPGKLEDVSELARAWFLKYLK